MVSRIRIAQHPSIPSLQERGSGDIRISVYFIPNNRIDHGDSPPLWSGGSLLVVEILMKPRPGKGIPTREDLSQEARDSMVVRIPKASRILGNIARGILTEFWRILERIGITMVKVEATGDQEGQEEEGLVDDVQAIVHGGEMVIPPPDPPDLGSFEIVVDPAKALLIKNGQVIYYNQELKEDEIEAIIKEWEERYKGTGGGQ